MNDPAGCTALVLYAGDSGDGLSPATESEAGGDAATPAGSATCSSGGDRCMGSQSSALSSSPQKRGNSTSQQTHETPRRFVGLSNQGATCYMNSLLQTLYMTPEFRAALYAWKHEPHVANGGAGGEGEGACDDADAAEDPSECIPLQLQRLFGQLQMSDRECIETRALTDSFGWSAQDSFQQHDVQELCRVLFDALESTFQGTVNEKLVNDLYQGSLRDYVTCKECHAESSRLDNFLDVSLVLRPFGSDKTMKSVTESLEYFLKPEVLDCDNQYCCQACGKKVDAVKGLKFERLPYLLSLQLKRFDFDYTTLQRIKLNDEMRFPMVLDMNKYVDNPAGAEGGEGFAGVEGGRQKHRSDFQRSLSLEKRKLQGLLGLVNEAEGASSAKVLGEGERTGVGADRGQTAGEGEGSGTGEAGQCCGVARGLEGVDGLVGAKGGVGEGAPGTDAKGSAGSVDPDTDETDREEGSMDSVESTEAKLDMADLPGLEDYWGNSFEDTAAGEDSSSANASAGRVENHRGGGSTGTGGAGSGRTGESWGGLGGATSQGDHGEDEDESFVPEEHEDDPLKLLRENGPWVYELFAVLIHSGSALGGHYYAHIKSLGDDAGWFTFNDSRVSSTTEEVVKQAWGGRWSQTSTWQRRSATSSGTGNGVASQRSSTTSSSPPPTSSATKWGSSAANAYMLMYRRVDPLKNKRHLRRHEVPEHVRQQVLEQDRKAQEAAAEAAAAAVARQSSIKIRVLLNGGKEATINGDKRKPLSELADAAAEAFGVNREALVPMAVVGPGPPGRQWTKGVPDEEDSAGGETDRETQDEGRSDCGGSAMDLVGGAGDFESDSKTLGEVESTSGMTTQAVTTKSLESEPQTRVVSERLIRLREHLTTPKLPGAPYDESSTPGELSFFLGKVVWLETREPGAPWSHFDANDVNIAMVRFDRETDGSGKVSERACGTTGGLGTPWLGVGDAGQDSADETAAAGSAVVRSSNGPTERGDGDEKEAAGPKYSLIPLPILGKFAPERNTRLQASGTTREIRAALAAFAGTDEARTRVFTMNSDNAERTYKLLCPPLRRRYSTKRLGEDFQLSSDCTSLAAQHDLEMKDGVRAGSMASGVATESSMVSKTRISETGVGLDTAENGDGLGSSKIVGMWQDGGISSSTDGFAWEYGGSSDDVRGQERAIDDPNDGEDKVVKLGEPGSSLLHKVYVEEVPEEECGMEGKQSLAVRVATDEANRITIKLSYHDGMTGPDSVTADKRWTSDQFREFLALLLGRGSRSFRIRKSQSQTHEVRPGRETLRSLMFYNHISVHLSPGRPLEQDEEALTIVPLDMGFPPGVMSPPASVIEALAGGKKKEEGPKQGGRGQVLLEKTEWPSLGDGLSEGDASTTVGVIVDEDGGTLCLNDDRSAPDLTRSNGETTSRLSCTAQGSEGDGPSTELRTGEEAKEGTVKVSTASTRVVAGKEREGAGSVSSEAPSGTLTDSDRSAEVPVALATGGATGSSTAGGPSPQVAAVFAEAAAVAAASAERSNAETEILTRTTVEGIPATSCWGEEFTMAVKMKSSVAQVREAVWEELKRRGLVPSTVASCPREQNANHGVQAEASCRTSRSLRLRDKLGSRPARIIRDSDGRLTPVSSRHSGGPRVLVTQVLSGDENLGSRDLSRSCGGELGDSGDVSEPTGRHDADAVANGADAPGGGAPPADATVIVVQWWDRWSWRLTQKYDAWVREAETVGSARNRLAKQVGVDPSNIRAHKCSYSGRLRLCDLGGYSTESRADAVPGSGVPVEAGGWGTASGNVSASCRWEDLDASHADVAVGSGTFCDGDLVLLQDISQPLKELSAATRASMGTVDSCTGAWSSSSPARASSIDSEGCDMTSIGSWYPGSASAPSGTVDDSGVTTGTLTRTSKPWSPSSSSATSAATTSSIGSAFKPKERALRIRTRRDRLQEGKASAAANGATAVAAAAVATAAAAATIATAAATAIAVGSVTSSSPTTSVDGSCSTSVEQGSRVDASEGMSQSSSIGAPASAIAAGNIGSSNGNGVTVVDSGSPGSLSDLTVVGRGGLEASSPGGDTVASSSSGSHAHGDAAGAMNLGPKASQSGDIHGTANVQDGDYRDLWGPWDDVSYMDSSVKIRSSAEDVARAGGISQFEDLA